MIVLTDAAHMPETPLDAEPYEEWLADDDDFAWRDFDENTAAGMCYTSGTTGNPKGVVYSHRSNVLHALDRQRPGHVRPFEPRPADAGGADVPRQCLGARLHRADGRGDARHARPEARRRFALRAARRGARDGHRGGADGLADAAAASGGDRPRAAPPEARGDRRRGLPALRHRGVRGALRRARHACLGHDRDEPDRHDLHAEAGRRRPDRRRAHGRAGEAGPSALRRGAQDHRRRGPRPALGRQDLRPPESARPGGRARLFQGRGGDPRRGRASSTPATSPISTRTATCGSPTARRT